MRSKLDNTYSLVDTRDQHLMRRQTNHGMIHTHRHLEVPYHPLKPLPTRLNRVEGKIS